jgi:hypothetical protein
LREEFEERTGTRKAAETGVLMEHEPERLRDVKRYEPKWTSSSMNIPGGENYREVQIIIKALGAANNEEIDRMRSKFTTKKLTG